MSIWLTFPKAKVSFNGLAFAEYRPSTSLGGYVENFNETCVISRHIWGISPKMLKKRDSLVIETRLGETDVGD